MLEAWSLEVVPVIPMIAFVIEASVCDADAFWLTQAPMTLDLRFGQFHWVWESVRPDVSEGRLSLRVFGKPLMIKESRSA